MQLLVSVRSAVEVDPALSGGADIIDAKEPSRGSLGSVTAATLAEILGRVPVERSISVALGDAVRPEDVVASIGALKLPARSAPLFLKLGFAGVRSEIVVSSLIETAVATSIAGKTRSRIIAVAYADAERAGTLSHELICTLAQKAGAAGVLLDTHTKDGMGLLSWISPRDLEDWVSNARCLGLITAVAGGLGADDVTVVAGLQPDVVGVRGAACERGRLGSVSADRVMALRRALDAGGWGEIRQPRQTKRERPVRETPVGGAGFSVSNGSKSRRTNA